jgi:23S rRNA (adenine1618-N6)-methyltransferase
LKLAKKTGLTQNPPSNPLMERPELHPRNPHRVAYNFTKLSEAYPALKPFVSLNAYGKMSIDFSEAKAVLALNQAILSSQYGVIGWKIPAGYLCPPIPGRADYIHHIADLLASDYGDVIPRGTKVLACDLGVGASVIYPLIGQKEYGWSFVGTDIAKTSLVSAQTILKSNPEFSQHIQLRHQKQTSNIFEGIVLPQEKFDVCLCNPPFHATAEEAAGENMRKWRNLGHASSRGKSMAKGTKTQSQDGTKELHNLNFGGQQKELWCEGGELSFIRRIMMESAQNKDLCLWFTTLVSKEKNLARLQQILESYPVFEYRIIDMVHGQKRSRILAWTFLNQTQRSERCKMRWG